MPTEPQRKQAEPKSTSNQVLPSPSRSERQTTPERKMSLSIVQLPAPPEVPSELHPTRPSQPCSLPPVVVAKRCRNSSCPSSCLTLTFDQRCPCSTMPVFKQPWRWAHQKPLLPTLAATAKTIRSCLIIPILIAKPKKAAGRHVGADASQLPSRRAWCCFSRCDSHGSRISLPSSPLSVNVSDLA